MLLSLVLSSALAGGDRPPGDTPPTWAYPVNPPNLTVPADNGIPLHVPDSDAAFTLTQIRDLNFSPDWHPGDHPTMPEVVARGRKPAVLACGCCHRADGSGGPENARLARLPAAYIAQQMADFKSEARKTSVQGRNPERMVDTARAITNEEIEAAATYFSALTPRSAIKIVEAANAPLGQRIIEVPEQPRAVREARWTLALGRPCSTGKRSTRARAGDFGRRQSGPLRHLPRPRLEGSRSDSRHRWALTELPHPAALRLSGRRTGRRRERTHEAHC